jgi:hypothetical protein
MSSSSAVYDVIITVLKPPLNSDIQDDMPVIKTVSSKPIAITGTMTFFFASNKTALRNAIRIFLTTLLTCNDFL